MSTDENGWERLETAQDFQRKIVNKPITAEGMKFVIHAGGKISGFLDDERFSGTWFWKDGYFCRVSEIGGEKSELDCEVIEVKNNQMRYTGNKGLGQSFVVKIG